MEKAFFDQDNINDSLDRVDGRLKVTGKATYAAEYQLPNIAHAVLVTSTIAKGLITALDSKQAERAPGILAVISHVNSPGVPAYGSSPAMPERATLGTPLRVFHDNLVYFSGQPVAVVVADTLQRAKYAASLVKVQYEKEPHQTDLEANISRAALPANVQRDKNSRYHDYDRGNPEALNTAAVKIEATYKIPTEHHNPLEPHALIAHWEAPDKLTLYDKTQVIKGTQGNLARAFKLPIENVKVQAKFIGGAFGSGIRVWPHVMAATLAAKKVQRPVKLALPRELMFNSVGSRPETIQKLSIGATKDGRLTAITHEAIAHTSTYEEHTERTVLATRVLYACPNVRTRYRLVNLDVNTPTWMRGPGEVTGVYALESAIDELAYALRIDPLELRLRNHADSDPEKNLPWSSKSLKECYAKGAEHFGWHKRTLEPRSMRQGQFLVGYGMASSMFGVHRNNAKARAVLQADGKVIVQSATSDIGPGTGTAMTQIAADTLNISPALIRFDLGESTLPDAPGQTGSTTVSSVGSAVKVACEALKQKLLQLAVTSPHSTLYNANPADLSVADGRIFKTQNPAVSITYTEILKQNNLPQLEVTEESKPGAEWQKYSMSAFGAHFVEVHVNPITGEVRVKRVVTCAGVGKVINLKTARSQSIGGIVGGIGMALTEESVMDHRFGRYVTADFANYHVPVHADVPQIDAFFIDEHDPHVNPVGAKGLGEIAIVGVSAAIANAVFHATGKRIRNLPITPDKLI
ncbi:xanthine dehydrogenase family protein molybdopterin-binding subunit [Adhaeribacter rhizoryzae]|uniref:Xanthine dehydrogenase family protein molybdopterin-binding subunit n=1 Tax=Adhaeribacter rhizoryzae TaxID=2607907 RepID=A0A5M6D142_9BACT|nr:xanthine dehydrogenase family protein molybdopterin-binding subunit [Adhaeribacter rhizoryzae]KAA5540360.1 xanthine dehydrogenase family protein molybdopterin-binding subunit [Adhaeribacter rhizoryzae]